MKQACEYNTKQNIKKSWAPGSDYLSSNLSTASYSLILAWLYNFYMPHVCVLSHFSRVWLFVTPWTVAQGSSVHGILQARILEWVMSPSKGSSWPRDQTWISCIAGGLYHWATREALMCLTSPYSYKKE